MHYMSDKRGKGPARTHLLRRNPGLCSVGSQRVRPVYPTLRKEREGWGGYRVKDRRFTRGNRMGHPSMSEGDRRLRENSILFREMALRVRKMLCFVSGHDF
jgi:hypothetical protein